MMTRRRAFSLAEILIVISIIVLMLALAVPAFNFITGSKSQGSANNQISAILGRARAEAIGLQETRGVFFFPDPTSGRYTAMLVHVPDAGAYSGTVAYTVGQYVTQTVGINTYYYACVQDNTGQPLSDVNYWKVADPYAIDSILPDTDSVTLPAGVGLQVLCDGRINSSTTPPTRRTDAYLKCGAILFDSYGKLVVGKRISICCGGMVGQKMGLTTVNYPDPTSLCITQTSPLYSYESSAGYVLYDRDSLSSQPFHVEPDNDYWVKDPRYPVANQAAEIGQADSEETWLDNNGLAVLINRYNGSLIKSE